MKLWPALPAAVGFCCAAAAPARAQKAVILVRHAEKVDESEDPLLSAAGKARARALARSLRTAGVKAVYVTQYKRTGLTAAPLAAAAGLKPITVHADARPGAGGSHPQGQPERRRPRGRALRHRARDSCACWATRSR